MEKLFLNCFIVKEQTIRICHKYVLSQLQQKTLFLSFLFNGTIKINDTVKVLIFVWI